MREEEREEGRGPEKLLSERSRKERKGRRGREREMLEPEKLQEERLKEVMWKRSSQCRPDQPAVPLEEQ